MIPKKFGAKNFRFKKILGKEEIGLGQKIFRAKKMTVQKVLGKIVGLNIFGAKTNFGPKTFWHINLLGLMIF